MLRRILRYLVGVPAVVVLAALGVANTHGVRLALDPFRPDDPALSLVLPFYAWLLAALIVGVVVGGLATRARWRRSASRADAERRSRDPQVEASRQLEASRQFVSAGH